MLLNVKGDVGKDMEKSIDKAYENRMSILFNVVLMIFMATLDSSIVNVALPKMVSTLAVTTESIAWVVTAYLIVISASILIFGRLGDIKGMSKVFQCGVLLFTVGSLLCGIAGSLFFLILARIVQAIGAAATMATSQGIITRVFPSNERGKALGISGTFVALGTMVGPPLGGFIINSLSWNYIFLINIPIGIFVFFMGMKILPKSVKAKKEKMDVKGALLFSIATIALFGSLIFGNHKGFTNPGILLGFIVSAISLNLFVFIEKWQRQPLLQLEIFNNPLFSLSLFCGFISFVAIGASNIIQPFYLQNVMKLSPFATGMTMMAYPIVLSIVAPISGRLSDKIGSEFLTFLGLTITSIALYLLSRLNEHSNLSTLIIFISIMSVGSGLFQSPNNSLVMSNVPKSKLGIAGSVNALVRNLGMVFGISVSITVLYSRMSSKLGYQVFSYVQGREDAFIFGMRSVYTAVAIICAVGAMLTGFRFYNKKAAKQDFYELEQQVS